MNPEDIDNLFRQQLDGHATPPSDNLWERLQLPATPGEPLDALDALFHDKLSGHATPPRRELWERLEDEHLRSQPRRRRVVAWWQYSAAAVLLLLVLAGGAGLWRGGYLGPSTGQIATTATGSHQQPQHSAPVTKAPRELADPHSKALASNDFQANPQSTNKLSISSEKNQHSFSSRATVPFAATSSPSIATTAQPHRPAIAARVAGRHQLQGPQPDTAAGSLATTRGRKTSAGQPLNTVQTSQTPSVAPGTRPAEATSTLATTTGVAAPAATPEIIEVEVRRGPDHSRPAAPVVVAVVETSPVPVHRARLRLGGLLRQADHLVHGEPVSLADATGPGETVTVQAHLGGRLISKTIQL